MAELVALIGAIVGILDVSYKVWENAKKDWDVPKAFELTNARLPVLQEILSTCAKRLGEKSVDLSPQTSQALEKSLTKCRDYARELRDIFEATVYEEGEKKLKAYIKAVRRYGKGKRVEQYLEAISKIAGEIANLQLVKDKHPDLKEQVDAVLEELQKVEPSVPDEDQVGSVGTHIENHGTGTQTNNINNGTGTQHIYGKKNTINHNSNFMNVPQTTMRQRLLDSLSEPNLNTRLNAISRARGKTFEWIFDEETKDLAEHGDRKEIQEWDNFPAWLRDKTTESAYLIEGTPGSGKSTLMRFVYEHSKLRELLSSDTLLIGHFFWLAGNPVQRRFKGMLASLARQLLEGMKHLDPNDEPRQFDKFGAYKEFSAWPEEQLQNLITLLVFHIDRPCLVFVDALDELDQDADDPATLFDFLQNLCRVVPSHTVKICVSSRPAGWFQDPFFDGCRRLKLQDLTREDIREYASNYLSRQFTMWGNALADEQDQVLKIIVERAESNFMWVTLALADVREGIKSYDSLPQLRGRLLNLPKGMESFFKEIWERYGNNLDYHRREAAHYLWLASLTQVGPLKLRELTLTMELDKDSQKHLLRCDHISAADIQQAVERTKRKLHVRTAGLVSYNSNGELSYIHRDAYHFLTETAFGRSRTALEDDELYELFRRWLISVLLDSVIDDTVGQTGSRSDLAVVAELSSVAIDRVVDAVTRSESLVPCHNECLVNSYVDSLREVDSCFRSLFKAQNRERRVQSDGIARTELFHKLRNYPMLRLLVEHDAYQHDAYHSVRRILSLKQRTPLHRGCDISQIACWRIENWYWNTHGSSSLRVIDYLNDLCMEESCLFTPHAITLDYFGHGMSSFVDGRRHMVCATDLIITTMIRNFQKQPDDVRECKDLSMFVVFLQIVCILLREDRQQASILVWFELQEFTQLHAAETLREQEISFSCQISIKKFLFMLTAAKSSKQQGESEVTSVSSFKTLTDTDQGHRPWSLGAILRFSLDKITHVHITQRGGYQKELVTGRLSFIPDTQVTKFFFRLLDFEAERMVNNEDWRRRYRERGPIGYDTSTGSLVEPTPSDYVMDADSDLDGQYVDEENDSNEDDSDEDEYMDDSEDDYNTDQDDDDDDDDDEDDGENDNDEDDDGHGHETSDPQVPPEEFPTSSSRCGPQWWNPETCQEINIDDYLREHGLMIEVEVSEDDFDDFAKEDDFFGDKRHSKICPSCQPKLEEEVEDYWREFA